MSKYFRRTVVAGSFGRGKPFAANLPGVVNQIIGRVLNGIFTKQSGAVLSWGNVVYPGGPVAVDPTNIYRTFNTAVVDTKSADQPANNIRAFPATFGNLRADGVNNLDASLLKNTTIHERLRLEFRAEFFNSTNHPQFSAPTSRRHRPRSARSPARPTTQARASLACDYSGKR
jgi:hypothetical protein